MKRVLPTLPPEVVVLDEPEECPYLPERIARRPLRVPMRRLARTELDARLAAGDRRSGPFLYNQECPACRACEALRVDVEAFLPSSSQKRAQKKGDAALSVEVGAVRVDAERVALFAAHESGRGLRRREGALDAQGYVRFLVQTCAEGFEIRYRHEGRLVAVAVVDRGAEALSAVYTFWDPRYAHLSVGTYSVLTQIRLCREEGLRWLYLGLAIEENHSMAYKLSFMPHERLVEGAWRRYARGSADVDGTRALG